MVGIISNSAAMFAQRNLAAASSDSQSSIARLSSGNRITRAADDVAGLAVGTSLATNVSTLKTALSTTSQANSLLQIADAGLKNVGDILQRQKSLAVAANSGSLSDTERAFLQQEFSSLTSEINRIVDNTTFNGIQLINGDLQASSGMTTALPTAGTNLSVAGTVGTTALTVGMAFTAGTMTEVNDAVIGRMTTDNLDVTGTWIAATTSKLNITIDGVAFQSGAVNATAGAIVAEVLTFTEVGTGDMAFTVTTKVGTAVASQANMDTFAAAIKADLLPQTISQDRGFATATSTSGSINTADLEGTVLSGMDGDNFVLRSSTFDTSASNTSPSIGKFTVVAETATTDGKVSTTIGGVTYSTVVGFFNDVSDLGTATNGTDAGAVALGAAPGAGVIRLYQDGDGITNPTNYFDIDIDETTNNVDMATAGDAELIQTALNKAFGSGEAGGLTYQVGTTATDTISVSVSGANTTDIYKDANGLAVTLDISTAGVADSSNGGDGTGSILASNVLDRAINTITSLRADVGALQSRFDFAASSISSSIQNTDAARSGFLDADIADESTSFATAQVRLQASISVLAQANQLPQNLLKLIG